MLALQSVDRFSETEEICAFGGPAVDFPKNLDVMIRMQYSEQPSFPTAVDPPLDLFNVGQEQQSVVGNVFKAVLYLREGIDLRLLPGVEGELEPRAAVQGRVRWDFRREHHFGNLEGVARRPDAR